MIVGAGEAKLSVVQPGCSSDLSGSMFLLQQASLYYVYGNTNNKLHSSALF